MKTLHTAISEADWIRLNDLLKQALEVEVLEREAWMAALPPSAAPLRGLLRQLLADANPDATDSTASHERLSTSMARVAADALIAMRRERSGDAIEPFGVREPDDFDTALAGMDRSPPDALMMVADALTNLNRQRVIDYAANHRIPAMYETGSAVRGGGLMSYGDDISENFKLVAAYVARILRGASRGDLPVQQPNRYFLAINLKTATSLGLSIPPSLRLRADELVE
jgi:hypothetical protein